MSAQHTTEHSRQRGLGARLRRLRPRRVLPRETQLHLRSATREQLLALRSLLDAAIHRLEQGGGKRT